MITLQLGTCNDAHNTVHKTFEVKKEVHCDIYRQCNLHNPQFILEYDASIVNYNYAYVPEWESYYFLGEPDVAPGGRMIISCRKDVLFSNAEGINNLECLIARNENTQDKMFDDNYFPVKSGFIIDQISFPFLFQWQASGTYSNILEFVGGIPTEEGD